MEYSPWMNTARNNGLQQRARYTVIVATAINHRKSIKQ